MADFFMGIQNFWQKQGRGCPIYKGQPPDSLFYHLWAFALLLKMILVCDISVWPFTWDFDRFGLVQLVWNF